MVYLFIFGYITNSKLMNFMKNNYKIFLSAIGCLVFMVSCDPDDSNNSNCFSPTQNLDIANTSNAIGCDCNSEIDEDVCVNGVALICEENTWITVEDGPCFNPEPLSNLGMFQNSLDRWNTLKNENGTSYSYEVHFTSAFGFSSVTQITVIENTVVGRSFHSFNGLENEADPQNSYEENQQNLNSNQEGAPAVTIDDLYDTCLEEVLVVDQEANQVFLEVFETGLIRQCIYIPTGCQDDCSSGVSITNFTWIE